jgi:predicted ATPase/DNA-binding CsgD family transcriptional regulator
MAFTTIRHNLPAEPNRFIGRERDIDELRSFLDAARAVTLCGVGGIGKTRLALHVVAMLADAFPDGAWLVELGDVGQPDLVVARVAGTIGVTEETGRPLVETLVEALRPRRLLLALDNCEHLVEACALLCQRLLAGVPELRVVATSREPLRVPAETVWRVEPLSIPPRDAAEQGPEELSGYEAISLFVERAAAARPGFALTAQNARVVTGLCRALDGVPLAIELAAARVRALSVEQISALLTDRFRLLAVGDRTAPPRQRTLRATIDWSHTLLTRKEQVLLRRLSVFAGWSLEMAEQICTDDEASEAGDYLLPGDVLDLITTLVDKSLVVVEGELLGQTRYRLLDSIREYAAERLDAADETASLQRKLCDYILRYLEHAAAIGMVQITAPWSATVDVFRRCDADTDNMQQVLAFCLASGDAETGLRLCTALDAYWIARGAFVRGSEWFDRFLASEPGSPSGPASGLSPGAHGASPGVHGAALVARAQLLLASDPAGAVRDAEAGLDLCRRARAQVWVAAALNLLAEADLHAGRLDLARERLDEALAVSRAIPDEWNEGYALSIQAGLAAAHGRLREAQRLGEAGLAVMRRIDQQWGVARTLAGLGSLARLRGDPGGARRCYLEALPILREIDARPEIARCLAGIGRMALDEGDTEVARRHLAESLRLSQATGARAGVAHGLEWMAALALRLGRSDLAVRLTAAASTLREWAGFPPIPGARIERYLAPARRDLGEPAVARLWAAGAELSADEAVALALGAVSAEPGNEAGPGSGLGASGSGPGASAGENDSGPGEGARGNGSGVGARGNDSGVTARGNGSRPGPLASATGPGAGEGAGSAPSTLTPREREIATLVSRGLTNRAIAGELVISTATVARHVTNILTKLGFQSRAQVAVWMSENDPGR